MLKKWEGIVSDDKESEVFKALADPAFDFRTIDGLIKATELSELEIEKIIAKYPDLIRESPVPYRKGGKLYHLYTLTTKKQGRGELLNIIRSLITKST